MSVNVVWFQIKDMISNADFQGMRERYLLIARLALHNLTFTPHIELYAIIKVVYQKIQTTVAKNLFFVSYFNEIILKF